MENRKNLCAMIPEALHAQAEKPPRPVALAASPASLFSF